MLSFEAGGQPGKFRVNVHQLNRKLGSLLKLGVGCFLPARRLAWLRSNLTAGAGQKKLPAGRVCGGCCCAIRRAADAGGADPDPSGSANARSGGVKPPLLDAVLWLN